MRKPLQLIARPEVLEAEAYAGGFVTIEIHGIDDQASIDLNRQEAEQLRDWLIENLEQ